MAGGPERRGFNPRPREGSEYCVNSPPPVRGFQSTPPRRERIYELLADRLGYVSIHAPAKGANALADVYDLGMEFQSTPPRRERLFRVPYVIVPKFQSTPPRRERSTKHRNSTDRECFNPRPREGSE